MPRPNEKSDVTVAMLRAFVTLSRTLNLTETSERLGATRQTVRRHISDLEAIKGRPLFSLERQEYVLTQYGREILADAESILRQVAAWSDRTSMTRRSSHWLEKAHFLDSSGREFHSQQHPISRIASSGPRIMKQTLAAWGQALTQIEDPAMAEVRPYLVVYRKDRRGWICVEIGEKSAYALWFGWAWSKSAIGRLSQEDNAGNEFNDFIADAYARIYGDGGVRLDHLYAHLPRESDDKAVPISFQRLLMGCVFPDGTPALAVLVLMTRDVDIDAMRGIEITSIPEDCEMVCDA
ncbi:LysR family transcriptional regulator [Aestuariicoccus sp. MJ-SS9]|uniref:LysR family transcriptional regulator n=1 Tax=Aestuariicoccus sp. MJ-SS9 TaxID=3079855 RepID=UPI00290EB6D6|nr:LysR family transcriptional regulator [Aestuariicoccus sp. MJ-SS9]MDU8910164.1 LysR family transcriptional regulator [Aestuariicoccus sp. MJ-SS9]